MNTSRSQSLQPLLFYFYKWEQESPEAEFLKQPYGKTWTILNYREAGQIVRRMAQAILSKGYPPGSNIAILSKNCYHWVLADLAIQMAGHISTPFFPNLEASQLELVLRKSQARMLFAGKLEAWHPEAVPDTVDIVRFPTYPGNVGISEGETWDTLLETHSPFEENPLPDLDDIWTILFTSGTTGEPKGVIHKHRSPAVILENELRHQDLGIYELSAYRFFSFLPLNHVAERIVVESACLLVGGVIYFAESLDTFALNLRAARPTLFFAVPRIWSKFQSAVFQRIPPGRFNLLMRIPGLKTFLKNKLRQGIGLDAAGVILTGAAPTPDHLKAWYQRLGLNLREVYGMTETCGAVTVSPLGTSVSGSVGKVVSTVETRIDPATQELQVKVPWMTEGYFNEPAKTASLFKEGYLCTGDQAEIDAEGNVFIIGRISDPFKTSKGKFVIPLPLEEKLLEHPCLEQVCVAGRGLPQPLALAVLSEVGKSRNLQEVCQDLETTLSQLNQDLPGFKRLSTLVLVHEEWSVENRILTPTLKVRRSLIDQRYQAHYQVWHEAPEKIISEVEP